jgi:hypothetical protein
VEFEHNTPHIMLRIIGIDGLVRSAVFRTPIPRAQKHSVLRANIFRFGEYSK